MRATWIDAHGEARRDDSVGVARGAALESLASEVPLFGIMGEVPRMKWVEDDDECGGGDEGRESAFIASGDGRGRGRRGTGRGAGRGAERGAGRGAERGAGRGSSALETDIDGVGGGLSESVRPKKRAAPASRSACAGKGGLTFAGGVRGGSTELGGSSAVDVQEIEGGLTLASMIVEGDDEEIRKLKRKESNRESARRSRLRKQTENENLSGRVRVLTRENVSLKENYETLRGIVDSLRLQNISLREELADLRMGKNRIDKS